MKRWSVLRYAVVAAALAACAGSAAGATLQVGPDRAYRKIGDAVNAARDGDTIEVDSGTYITSQGWCWIYKNGLTIRGVGPTRPVIDARHGALNLMAVFIVMGSNTTFENLEIKNCRLLPTDGANGTGIRSVGPGLTVRNCYIHDCDDGILGGGAGSAVLIEYCEFNHCGHVNWVTEQPDAYSGYSHNIYIGGASSFTLRYCWSHNCGGGQDVKTRAQVNYILYNRISNELGQDNYELDIPNAGTSYVIGNIIQQSPYSTNGGIITYGTEGASNPDRHLYLVNNTIVNQRNMATFLWNASGTAALVQNNILQGPGTLFNGPVTQVSNWITADAGFADPAGYDYHLTPASIGAIDKGTAPGVGISGFSLSPVSLYVHPRNGRNRPADATIDIGAYEYRANQPPAVEAVQDISLVEGQAAALHATAGDPDGDPLLYTWTQTSGLPATLDGADTPDLAFTAGTVATLAQASQAFQVTVDDGMGGQATAGVNVRVYMLGDISRDDSVDVLDLLALLDGFGVSSGDASYDTACDLNGDGVLDVIDLLALVGNWGRTLG